MQQLTQPAQGVDNPPDACGPARQRLLQLRNVQRHPAQLQLLAGALAQRWGIDLVTSKLKLLREVLHSRTNCYRHSARVSSADCPAHKSAGVWQAPASHRLLSSQGEGLHASGSMQSAAPAGRGGGGGRGRPEAGQM